MTTQNNPVSSDLQRDGLNESIPDGCTTIRFSEWEYLPWNNSDNIVGQGVQLNAAQVRTNLLVILFLIGGPANVINMVVFFKQGLKDRVNLLLFSLSLADVMFLTVAIFLFAENFYYQFTNKAGMTASYIFFINYKLIVLFGFRYVSFVLSAFIAWERCYCVLRPLQYQAILRTKSLAVIITAVYVIIIGLQFIVVSRFDIGCAYNEDIGVVFNMFVHSEFYTNHKNRIDFLDSIVFGTVLQSGVVIVVVTATVITIIKLRQAVAWRKETTSSVSAKEVALTKMLVGTSFLLIVCITPNYVLRVACLFLPELNTGRRFENVYLTGMWIAQMFAFINSSFNFFIYYMMGSRYRETFWSLFRGKAGKINMGK